MGLIAQVLDIIGLDILGTTYPYMQCMLDLKNDSPDLYPIHTPEVISLRSIWLHIGEAVQLLL